MINLNTSHVTVKHIKEDTENFYFGDLNTSHVTVKPNENKSFLKTKNSFNYRYNNTFKEKVPVAP